MYVFQLEMIKSSTIVYEQLQQNVDNLKSSGLDKNSNYGNFSGQPLLHM